MGVSCLECRSREGQPRKAESVNAAEVESVRYSQTCPNCNFVVLHVHCSFMLCQLNNTSVTVPLNANRESKFPGPSVGLSAEAKSRAAKVLAPT
jgi:hypothetical protein